MPVAEEHSLKRPGVTLHYKLWGSAQSDSPVVFLHGWAGSSQDWQGLLPFLTPHQTCLTCDLAGFGASQFDNEQAAQQADYSLDRYVGDLLAVLDAAHYERIRLVGHSWGGVVGMAFAARYPARVESLVAIGSAYFDPDRLLHQILKWVSYLIAWLLILLKKPLEKSPRLRRLAVRRYFRHQPGPTVLDALMQEVLIADRQAIIQTLLAGYRVQFKTLCPAIACPTLYVGCQQDIVAPPAYVQPFVPLTPHAAYLILDDCGHFPMLEQPERTSSVLAEFWKSGINK